MIASTNEMSSFVTTLKFWWYRKKHYSQKKIITAYIVYAVTSCGNGLKKLHSIYTIKQLRSVKNKKF